MSMNEPEQIRGQSPLGETIAHLAESAGDLEEVVSSLLKNLDPVLGQVPPIAEGPEGKPPEKDICEMGANIRDVQRRVQTQVRVLRNMNGRIEV